MATGKLLYKIFVNPRGIIGGSILLIFVFIAIFAPYIATHDPYEINAWARYLRPDLSSENLLGTDRFGRDLFSRIIYGSRISLVVGVSIMLTTSFAATFLGLVAAYYSRVDNIIMRIIDGMMAFPPLVLAIVLMAMLGPRLSNVIIALTISYVPAFTRVVRSNALSIKQFEFVDAARSIGLPSWRIVLKHILPNCWATIIIMGSLRFGYAVLAEAALSFLGVGIHPEVPSWGTILSAGRDVLRVAPWVSIFPGIAIFLVVLAINLIGERLRDVLDPLTLT